MPVKKLLWKLQLIVIREDEETITRLSQQLVQEIRPGRSEVLDRNGEQKTNAGGVRLTNSS